MDFSEASSNNVTAADVAAVADQLQDGSWIVVNTGWSRFYSNFDLATSPYINGWNFPGVSRAALNKLIEIEEEKDIRINGIAIDDLGIDSGEEERGVDDQYSDSLHSHVRGLQRGWKFVENAANLDPLTTAGPEDCTLVVGGLARCERQRQPRPRHRQVRKIIVTASTWWSPPSSSTTKTSSMPIWRRTGDFRLVLVVRQSSTSQTRSPRPSPRSGRRHGPASPSGKPASAGTPWPGPAPPSPAVAGTHPGPPPSTSPHRGRPAWSSSEGWPRAKVAALRRSSPGH